MFFRPFRYKHTWSVLDVIYLLHEQRVDLWFSEAILSGKNMLGNFFLLKNPELFLLGKSLFHQGLDHPVLVSALQKASTLLTNWGCTQINKHFLCSFLFQQSMKLHHLVEAHNSTTVSVCGRKCKFHYSRFVFYPYGIRKWFEFVFLISDCPSNFYLQLQVPCTFVDREEELERTFHLKGKNRYFTEAESIY